MFDQETALIKKKVKKTLDLTIFRKLEFDHLANLSGLGAARRGIFALQGLKDASDSLFN